MRALLGKVGCSIVVLSLAFLLAGCEPTTFGVPNAQWNSLTPDQKQIAMNNYYAGQQQQAAEQARVNEINAQNAPLNNAISGLLAAIPEKTHTSSQSQTTGSMQCSGSSCQMSSDTHGSSTSISSPF